jgi:hypothetical protein
MKLAKEALLEIVAILQDGLVGSKDISQALRDLDLVVTDDSGGCPPECMDFDQNTAVLGLSPSYLSTHPRGEWKEN